MHLIPYLINSAEKPILGLVDPRSRMIISSTLHVILLQDILASDDEYVGRSISEKQELCNLFDSLANTAVITDSFRESVVFNKFKQLITGITIYRYKRSRVFIPTHITQSLFYIRSVFVRVGEPNKPFMDSILGDN